jgi:cyclase
VGEIVLNSIDHDGEMKGYDLEIARRIRDAVTVPMSVLGGAGSLHDIGRLINQFGTIGAAAGSYFVFKGVYRCSLIILTGPKKTH